MSAEILARLEQNRARARQLAEARQAVVEAARQLTHVSRVVLTKSGKFVPAPSLKKTLNDAVRALENLEEETHDP